MTKQERIREGLREIIIEHTDSCLGCDCLDCQKESKEFLNQVFNYFDSQGVVIKVDRELPKDDEEMWQRIQDKLGGELVEVEPLIEGV